MALESAIPAIRRPGFPTILWERRICRRDIGGSRAMVSLLHGLHVLAALYWVGGIAFAYSILRPAAGPLEPPVRLLLWRRVFERFLPWVGVSILALLISGYGMVFFEFGGFRNVGLFVHVMQGIGIVMMLLYLHLLFAPWRRFRAAVDGGALPEAARNLNQIRLIVATNLTLGIITVVVASTGRYW
jgi:uncharacterized membrane protein